MKVSWVGGGVQVGASQPTPIISIVPMLCTNTLIREDTWCWLTTGRNRWGAWLPMVVNYQRLKNHCQLDR